MTIAKKPDEHTFASAAKRGEVDNFPDIARGWGFTFEQTQGIPTMEHFNALFKRVDEHFSYLMQRGLPEWSATQHYPAGAYVQHNGKSYRAVRENQAQAPDIADSSDWARWAMDYTDLGNYLPNSKKSSATNSNSEETVATSKAVKTAFDKAEEAKTIAEGKWSKQRASDTQEGTTVLSHATNGTDRTKAASEFALGEVAKKSLPLGAVIGFPKEIANPAGFLLADGSTFNQAAFPDLYRMLGNSNRLPNLQRSDVGVVAWFAVDEIPAGWIPFDDIPNHVGSRADQYPELYRHLSAKYGNIRNVPKVGDRFLRNAAEGLHVGEKQEDAIKKHVHDITVDTGAEREPYINQHIEWQQKTQDSTINIAIGTDDGFSDNYWITPKLDSRFATGGAETRPKSLVLKLCIKAQNSFDDVKFWVKAFGSIDNEGVLDASQLAQGLQGKAERNHTHTVSQITDFNQKTNERINAAFIYEERNGFTIRKYPDGTMIQTYSYERNDLTDWREDSFAWAQAFVNTPVIFGNVTSSVAGRYDNGINILSKSNNTHVYYWLYEHSNHNQGLCRVQFLAIGRWK